MYPLLQSALFSRQKNAVVAGQTDQDGAVLDMLGFDAICGIALLGTVTDGSVDELTLRVSDNADGSSSSEDATTGATTAATSSNKMLVLDVIRPSKRYCFFRLKRGTQNAVIDGIVAMQYRARFTSDIVQPSSVLDSQVTVVG